MFWSACLLAALSNAMIPSCQGCESSFCPEYIPCICYLPIRIEKKIFIYIYICRVRYNCGFKHLLGILEHILMNKEELQYNSTSLIVQMIKNLPAMWETQVWSLGWEDPLAEETATHSNILAWRIPWTEEPAGLQVHGVTKSRTGLSD